MPLICRAMFLALFLLQFIHKFYDDAYVSAFVMISKISRGANDFQASFLQLLSG